MFVLLSQLFRHFHRLKKSILQFITFRRLHLDPGLEFANLPVIARNLLLQLAYLRVLNCNLLLGDSLAADQLLL
jgi:hypothetical protein